MVKNHNTQYPINPTISLSINSAEENNKFIKQNIDQSSVRSGKPGSRLVACSVLLLVAGLALSQAPSGRTMTLKLSRGKLQIK
jgi:hypothetical protein